MTQRFRPTVHSLIGGMTNDYFNIWCEKCEAHIDGVQFHSEDIIGVQLKATCPVCKQEHVFKLKVSPPLTTR